MIGNWNVRTMYVTGAAAQVARKIREYRFKVLDISECRWTGAGKTRLLTGETLSHAGEEGIHQEGVALMLSSNAAKSLMEWSPVNSRITIARFYSKYKKVQQEEINWIIFSLNVWEGF